MKQYLGLIKEVLAEGTWQDNRTGVRTLAIPGAALKFRMKDGFPAMTTRKLAFKSVAGELCGFLRGKRSAADFRALGCKVWDQNANENADWLANPFRQGEDDIGMVYGVQWRGWPAFKRIELGLPKSAAQLASVLSQGYTLLATQEEVTEEGKVEYAIMYKAIDQLRWCLDTIMTNPTSRRILFHGWNWAQLDEMALPPCHLLYQFLVNVEKREISLCLYIRSNDLGLGFGFNVAEASMLLHLVGRLTGYTPGVLNYFVGDAHVYETSLPMLEEQLKREPYALPQLVISDRVPAYAETGKYEPEWLEKVEPSDFSLEGYLHHAPLTAPMAV